MRVTVLSLSCRRQQPQPRRSLLIPVDKSGWSRCAGCHGTDGNGGELGPNIATPRFPPGPIRTLMTVLRQGSDDLPACLHSQSCLDTESVRIRSVS